ncbi:MAG: hypothetical protein A2V66_12765 [Ignavibacteria bacterium RBG_13_36_8]|nr:MAG: hypothetical protein A2V66_12765 [Ignavibacteria bacterium RBG_13_36_8]
MRILFISPKIPIPPNDGHKISIYGVIKHLNLRGHKIDFAGYSQGLTQDEYLTELKNICMPYIVNYRAKNNLVKEVINCFDSVPYNVSKYRTIKMKRLILDLLMKRKYDIIHVTNIHMAWVVGVVRRVTDTPVVLRQENLEMMIMKRFYGYQRNPFIKLFTYFQYRKFVKYEPRMCKKFDSCVMMSRNEEESLLKYDSTIHTAHIPIGVETKLLSVKSTQKEKFSIVHIGNLSWYPNCDGLNWFLKEIFPEVVKQQPDTRLYIYSSRIPISLRISPHLLKNITQAGYVEDIWNEIKNKSLAVIPLRIGSGIRVKILEMLAAGINILTTTIGKEGLEVESGKQILIADRKEEFVQTILNFFEEKYDSSEMVNKGKELIREKYTWGRVADEFEMLYKKIARN